MVSHGEAFPLPFSFGPSREYYGCECVSRRRAGSCLATLGVLGQLVSPDLLQRCKLDERLHFLDITLSTAVLPWN